MDKNLVFGWIAFAVIELTAIVIVINDLRDWDPDPTVEDDWADVQSSAFYQDWCAEHAKK